MVYDMCVWCVICALVTMFQVRERLNLDGQEALHATAIIACFLIQEGADQYVMNNKGLPPLQVCPAELVALVVDFKGPEGGR